MCVCWLRVPAEASCRIIRKKAFVVNVEVCAEVYAENTLKSSGNMEKESGDTSDAADGHGGGGGGGPLSFLSNFTGGNSNSSNNSGSGSGPSKKSGRKISLPWFRQSSVTSHATLARQHTIDSPGSFRFFRKVISFLSLM